MSLRSKPGKVLLVALSLVAVAAAGCGRDKTGDGGAGAQIDGVAWQPFALQPGQYFKYEVVDHPVNKKGWVSLEVVDKGGGQLELRWQGERQDGMKLSVTVAEKPEMSIIMSRPPLSPLPVATPFHTTVLSDWWEMMAGFQMKDGAEWSVAMGEMVPAGFTAKVDGYCTIAGHKGFKNRLVVANKTFSEACISPLVPLPLQVRLNDTNDKKYKAVYEARLVEYRSGKK